MLRNPTPLFLPTKWNASQQAGLGSVRRELESAFQDFPARLAFGDAAPSLAGFPPAIVAPEGPVARLAGAYDARPYAGLGRADREPAPLAARGAFVEVTGERDGNRVLAEALAEARPPAAGALWQPVEFVAAVDAAGLVGVPVLTRSSRLAAVDGYFQAYLVKTLRLGERLAPGFYRVCVGP